MKSNGFIPKTLKFVTSLGLILFVVWITIPDDIKSNIQVLTINSINTKGLVQYESGDLKADLPAFYNVSTISNNYVSSISASSEIDNAEIIIKAYAHQSDPSSAIHDILKAVDYSTIFDKSYSRKFTPYYFSKKYKDVVFSELLDSSRNHLLRGELFCFCEKGYTVYIFSYGRFRDYKSVRKLIDNVIISGEAHYPSAEFVRSVIDEEIVKLNTLLNVAPGKSLLLENTPGIQQDKIKQIRYSVDHNSKIITKKYTFNASLAEMYSFSDYIHGRESSDRLENYNCYYAINNPFPELYWYSLTNGYSIESIFCSKDGEEFSRV